VKTFKEKEREWRLKWYVKTRKKRLEYHSTWLRKNGYVKSKIPYIFPDCFGVCDLCGEKRLRKIWGKKVTSGIEIELCIECFNKLFSIEKIDLGSLKSTKGVTFWKHYYAGMKTRLG